MAISRLREREGTRRAAVGRVRVFFFDVFVSFEKEDPHPTLSRESGRGLWRRYAPP